MRSVLSVSSVKDRYLLAAAYVDVEFHFENDDELDELQVWQLQILAMG